ncbi:unnamed protein product [Cochlearia groenlandica]
MSSLSNIGSSLVHTLGKMGSIVKWPRKMTSKTETKDTRKWCDFHSDRGLLLLRNGGKARISVEARLGDQHDMQTPKFTAEESEGMMIPHHDALVITLLVANCLMKRIFVDKIILFLAAYKDMGLDESKIVSKSAALVEFNGELKQTIGEITLRVYT